MTRHVPLGGRSFGLLVGLGLGITGYYGEYVQPQVAQLRHLAPQVATLEERVVAVRETLVRFDEISQRIGRLERRWEQLTDTLVSRTEVPMLLARLSSAASSAGWRVQGVEAAALPPPVTDRREDEVHAMVVRLEGAGAAQAVATLLDRIERDQRGVYVSEWGWRAIAGEPGRVSGRMVLTVYVPRSSR